MPARTLSGSLIAASLLAHLAVLRWVPPPALRTPTTPESRAWIELTPAVVVRTAEPARREPSVAAIATRPRKPKAPHALELTSRAVTPAEASPTVNASPPSIDVSPRRAAATAKLETATRDSCGEAPLPAARCDTVDSRSSVEARLSQSLREAAASGTYLAAREPPRLRRQGDGSYRYQGPRFDARIGLDGQVAFQDRPVFEALPIPIAGTFDLSDAIHKHVLNAELHSAEKAWFLEQTGALRGGLADGFRARERQAMLARLTRELERVVTAPNTRGAEKRAAILGLWEDCGDDRDTAHVRALVEAFVRERMPPGSELGFTTEELERYNHARGGLRRFDPYRLFDAGAPG